MTKTELTEKVGEKSFFDNDYCLAGILNYESGIESFDEYLNGKTLKQIGAVIHLSKYPKGLLVKIAKNFSSFPFGISYSEIAKINISENTENPKLTIEITDKLNIVFSFKKDNLTAIKEFCEKIPMNFDKTKTIKEDVKSVKEDVKIDNNTKHGVPTLLSFFIPGLGQLIKGHFLKAFAIWGSGILIWFAFFGSLFSGQLGLSFFIYLIPFAVWVWNLYDAYNSNENWG